MQSRFVLDTLSWRCSLGTLGAVREAVGDGAEVLGQNWVGNVCHEHTGGISSPRYLGEQRARRRDTGCFMT